jgi:phenylacetic acid degradation operon negative regulatory protein
MPSAVDTVGAMVAAFDPRPVRTAALEVAAAQVGIDANHVRVALSRLRAQGKVVSEQRGLYRLSERVKTQQTALGSWRNRLQRLRAWDGAYLMALTSWLPKSDRKAARRRGRALTRLGFQEHRPGIALRPANLDLSLQEAKSLLQRLGFDEEGELVLAAELDFEPRAYWKSLMKYGDHARTLRDGQLELQRRPSPEAAVVAFRVANDLIREAIRDPLLPDAWVDAEGRRDFWSALVEYDRYGRTLWRSQIWDPIEEEVQLRARP